MALGNYKPQNDNRFPAVCSICKTGQWFKGTKISSPIEIAKESGWDIVLVDGKIQKCICANCRKED